LLFLGIHPFSSRCGRLFPCGSIFGLALFQVAQYDIFMISTFADKELEKLFHRKRSKSPEHLQRRLRLLLGFMQDALLLEDLAAIPGGHLEALKGRRKGQHGLRVSGNWRLCFTWREGYIHDPELVDYH
jgi:toxin HigB-1